MPNHVNTVITTNTTITCVVIIIINLLIWRKTRKDLNTTQNARSREISRQVGRALLFQAIIPFLCCFLPTLMIFIYTQLNVNIPLNIIQILFYPFLPQVVAPISTLLIVGEYRKRLIGFIMRRTPQSSSVFVNTAIVRPNV